MNNYYLLRVRFSLIALLVFVISACERHSTLPSHEIVPGVYLQSGFEFYRWKGGLAVMIWHDSIKNSGCEGSTLHQSDIMRCFAFSEDDRRFDWYLETSDGETATFSINDRLFDLSFGNLFVIKNSEEGLDVTQLCRDLSKIPANTEEVIEFGLSDPTIRDFIQNQAQIRGCISSYYISRESSPDIDVEAARKAIIKFFSYLHAGEYERASNLYGGSYTIMLDHNPGLDPEDYAGLHRNACEINGAQCLEVRRATLLDQPTPTEFRFVIEFSNEDGSLFTRGGCCGENSINGSPEAEFIYTSRLECTGEYRVMELPVYLP